MVNSIKAVMQRHLEKLSVEIDSYKNEEDLWLTSGSISNSAGNLCLHLCGNLQHFIGAVLGDTGYIRHREAEFSATNIPRKDIQQQINDTITSISKTLDGMDNNKLQDEYPVQVFGKPMTTEYFLVHLTSHLGYHLGQINYHRRLLAQG